MDQDVRRLFCLIHSPSVGPATWEPVAECLRRKGVQVCVPSLLGVAEGDPPFWPAITARVQDTLSGWASNKPVALAVHSNAGFFAPQIAAAMRHPVAAIIFVDASIPPASGLTALVQPGSLDYLRDRVTDGRLPKWTDWWAEEDVRGLFPDEATRARISAEEPRLPLSYYEQKVPVIDGWMESPCGYIVFGPPYDALADQARQHGWPVERIDGQHLHMLVDPDGVAEALIRICDRLLGQAVKTSSQ